MNKTDSDSKYESSKSDGHSIADSKSDEANVVVTEEKGAQSKGEECIHDEQLPDDTIVNKFQEFFFSNDDLAGTFEIFVKDHCHIIDLTSDEYKLEYTTVFEQYKDLFERKMEGYIVDELRCTVRQFYEVLKRKMEESESSNEAIFGQILIAVTDFDVFMTMMREGARELMDSAHK